MNTFFMENSDFSVEHPFAMSVVFGHFQMAFV